MEKKMGRPRKEFNKEEFEKLCAFQCTLLEICDWFDVDDKTLNKWCVENYETTFSEVFSSKRSKGLISLRRNQFKMAETNPTMAIWLGKQHLGQKDRQEIEQNITTNINAYKELTIEELRKLAE